MLYVSAGMGYRFSALLVSLMALHSHHGTETPFGLFTDIFKFRQNGCHVNEYNASAYQFIVQVMKY